MGAVPRKLTLKFDETLGVPSGAKGLSVVSLYPEPRVYGKGLSFGNTLDVSIAPYETVVLSVAARQRTSGLPAATDMIGGQITSTVAKSELRRIGQSEGAPGFQLKLDAQVAIRSPQAKLLLLLEGDKKVPDVTACTVQVNGKKTRAKEKFTLESYAEAEKYRNIAFAASSLPPAERWRYVEVPLQQGSNDISVELLAGSDCVKISAWVWATKLSGGISDYPNSLPQPEVLSVDGAVILQAVETNSIQ